MGGIAIDANYVNTVNILGSNIDSNLVGIRIVDVPKAIIDETSASVATINNNFNAAIKGERSKIYLRNNTQLNNNVIHAIELIGSYTVPDAELIIGDFGCIEMNNNAWGGAYPTSVIFGRDFVFNIDAVNHAPNNGNVSLASKFVNPQATYFADVCYDDISVFAPTIVNVQGHYWGQGIVPNASMFNIRQRCSNEFPKAAVNTALYSSDCLTSGGCGTCDIAEICDSGVGVFKVADGTVISGAVSYNHNSYLLQGRLIVKKNATLTISESDIAMREKCADNC